MNGYLLDGVYNVDPKLGTVGVRPAVDAIYEFGVETSTYDAAFGRNASGQVNVITKAGSNRFNGTAYEFFRERRARQPQRVRAARRAGARTTTATSSAARSAARSPPTGCSSSPTTRARGSTRASRASRTCRPSPSARATSRNRCSRRRSIRSPVSRFLAARIPSFALSPIGSAIAALYPLPNRSTPFANYVSSPTSTDDVDQFDGRLDHAFSGASRADRPLQLQRPTPARSRSPVPASPPCPASATPSIGADRTCRSPTTGRSGTRW